MLSVIIPTYNRAWALPRALESLINQSLSADSFEVVIIDDGSTDRTSEVVVKYSDKLKIVYHQLTGHQGVSVARNEGVARATGDILAFFDDDAIASDDWLENIVSHMASEEIITGRVEPIDQQSFWRWFAPHYNQGDQPCISPVLLEGNCAIKRSVFDRVGLFDANLDYGHEGEEFIRRCRGYCAIKYYPDVVIYHEYAKSLTHYLKKQFQFGQKMSYLYHDQLENIWKVFLPQRKASAPSFHSTNQEQKNIVEKITVALVARLGRLVHLAGEVDGYYRYRSVKK